MNTKMLAKRKLKGNFRPGFCKLQIYNEVTIAGLCCHNVVNWLRKNFHHQRPENLDTLNRPKL